MHSSMCTHAHPANRTSSTQNNTPSASLAQLYCIRLACDQQHHFHHVTTANVLCSNHNRAAPAATVFEMSGSRVASLHKLCSGV
jgi:hypothetical protein